MLDDFRKSIYLILHERITSPLSGTLALSWLGWNWRPVFYLFFSPSNVSIPDRFKYIDDNYISLSYNLLYPLCSAIFLITLYPLLTTGALNIWLRYKSWQNKIKNAIEGNELITIDQKRELEKTMARQTNDFDSLLSSKNDEIQRLKDQIEIWKGDLVHPEIMNDKIGKEIEQFNKILSEAVVNNKFQRVSKYIGSGYSIDEDDLDLITFLFSQGIVVRNAKSGLYDYTDKGQKFLAYFHDHTAKKK